MILTYGYKLLLAGQDRWKKTYSSWGSFKMSGFQWPFCAFSEEYSVKKKISYMNLSVREVFSLCPRNLESMCKIIWLWASVRKDSRTFCRFSMESLILKYLRNQSCCLSDIDFCWLCYLSFDQSCLLIMEKEMATHSSVLAWKIPGMGEPGGLPSMGSHRVRHD